MIIRNDSRESNKLIRMISEGSCDTRDCTNGCWKFSKRTKLLL